MPFLHKLGFGGVFNGFGDEDSGGPAEAIVVTAITSASGNHVIIDFDMDITGTTNIHDFTVKVDGMVDDITMANMLLLSRIQLTLATPILNVDINITVSHYGGGDTNMAVFLDYPVTNVVPVVIADPAPPIDLDGDGLPDTIIYENGNITITEDDDSYNVDLNGDGIEDIHVEK